MKIIINAEKNRMKIIYEFSKYSFLISFQFFLNIKQYYFTPLTA